VLQQAAQNGGAITEENKSHFMFGSRSQNSIVAPQISLTSLSAFRDTLLKGQASSRAAMLALSAGNKSQSQPDSAGTSTQSPQNAIAKGTDDSKNDSSDDSDDEKEKSKGISKIESRPAAEIEMQPMANKRAGVTVQVAAPTTEDTAHAKMVELQNSILGSSTIMETLKRIKILLEQLPLDNLGSRVSPLLLMNICELRSLMHSLYLATKHPIEYMTRSLPPLLAGQHASHHSISAGSISQSMASLFYGTRSSTHRVTPVQQQVEKETRQKLKVSRLSGLTLGQSATDALEEPVEVDNSFFTSVYR
jgi:hypothetical protein